MRRNLSGSEDGIHKSAFALKEQIPNCVMRGLGAALHGGGKMLHCFAAGVANSDRAQDVRNVPGGDFIEALDRVGGNLGRRHLDRRRFKYGRTILGHGDHAPAIGEVTNDPAVVRRIDDGRRFGREPRKVLTEMRCLMNGSRGATANLSRELSGMAPSIGCSANTSRAMPI